MPTLYTGPLSAEAMLAHGDKPGCIVLTGLAHDCYLAPGTPPIRVRIEMEAEEAEDLIRSLKTLIPSAKEGRRDGR
jgi:hypothetical protein